MNYTQKKAYPKRIGFFRFTHGRTHLGKIRFFAFYKGYSR